ncbi:UPF0271 protein [Microbulbifer donghaiensis]|uniref:UPF0271 protein n=1 Tax=Microbulbifer donghaiensis TaxID=494016 RepID=A0A1M5HT43_9GAMM|nr:5-oxoprolinase subunit PxpA [Microbulbifer donghaiensis]SHG19110.1 UPF0271 protein [Microbulbifer donghaiensis]
MQKIDINCDLGEGETSADCQRDALIMPHISRCNIACGGHAGNLDTMQLSVDNARKNRLIVGAHPGYPDRENFGRRSLDIGFEHLLASVGEQVRRLQGVARAAGTQLDHIKLHGALYNDAEANSELAENITAFVAAEFPQLKILGLANAQMEIAAQRYRHAFIREGFMDRRYLNNHQLAPRAMENSVIADTELCLEQALRLATGQIFQSISGDELQFSVDSICLHGDNTNAPSIAQQLVRYLHLHDIKVRQ